MQLRRLAWVKLCEKCAQMGASTLYACKFISTLLKEIRFFLERLTVVSARSNLLQLVISFRRKVVTHQEEDVLRKRSRQEGSRSHREDGGARFGLERTDASWLQRTAQDTQRGHIQAGADR
jgi:hypothetical protein